MSEERPSAMRVLVASHLYPSAGRPHGAPWLVEQVTALADHGLEVEVLCCSPYADTGAAGAAAPGGGVPVHYRSTSAGRLDRTRAGLVISTARYRYALRRFLAGRRGRYDVLHAHFGFPDGVLCVHAGRAAGLPVVVTLHGSDVHQVLVGEGAFGAYVRRALSEADHLVCVSEEMTGVTLSALPPRSAARTSTVANGYDPSLFRIGHGERDLGYLFVGELSDIKGVEALVEVYLSDVRLHRLPLTVVGEGPLSARLKQRIEQHAGTGTVRLLGRLGRNEVADAMRRARALVLPSLREGYGLVAAEALACGTPVVGSAVGALPQIIASPAAGVLVKAADRHDLADALHAVSEWPYSPREVAAASGARPWSERAAEIVEIYRHVLTTRARAEETDS